MKRALLVFLAFLLVFSLAACGENKKKEKSPHLSDYSSSAAKYFPLAVKNTWKYRVEYLGSAGEMDVTIVSSDGEWFEDNRGGRLKIDRHGIRDDERYLLMFPLQREEWTAILRNKSREIRKTVGVDESVTVPAGTFEGAIKVHTYVALPKKKALHSYHYFVANVGIVKIETFLEDINEAKKIRQTVTELVSYTLNKE
ncbi:hypothetical protein IKR20_02175 [bacterium]|nr:hypothetical protein [bacterium]